MSKENRVYFVIDMKSFFASVECSERGLDSLKTNLVVADSSRGEGTICLAVSPHLKKLGIKNRCRFYEIPKNINFIVAKPRMKKYIEYASEIYAIYLKYIDKNDIHVYSIDECFLDVTDYLNIYKISAHNFAKKLMKEIKDKLNIPSSTGIGTNLFLAKVALDITAKKSKDNIGYLDENIFKKTLWKHTPLTDFWQISTGISQRLNKLGINTMEKLSKYNEERLYKEFGINAELLIDHSKGIETCTMKDIKNYKSKSRSISSSQILPFNYNYKDAKLVLEEMIQNLCYNLFQNNFVTNHISINIGYGDNRKDVAKASKKMVETTNLFSFIINYANKIYDEIIDRNKPIRKIGITFSDIQPIEYEQYDLLTNLKKVEKEKNIIKSILNIQNKFGKNALLKVVDLKENATQKERNKMIGGHNSGEK